MAPNHILIAGASGVIGAGAVEHFAGLPGWRVTGLSRRVPVVAKEAVFHHVAADLDDRASCARTVAELPPITHLVYAAAAEAPGLVSGWYDPALIERNGRMFANLLDPLAGVGHLRQVCLLQGTKAYGGHHHLVPLPCRESRQRDNHPNFYWLHEDHLRLRAREAGFVFTIFRPPVLLGAAAGVAMNPVAALGAYAALTKELELPFAFPGNGDAMWEMVDTGLLAEALAWAAVSPAAVDQVFNITNGDVLVLAHEWSQLAMALGLRMDGESPASFAGFLTEPGSQAAWTRLAERHGLRVRSLPALLGESHHYMDLLLGTRVAERRLPMLLSTIKLRQAGFGACRDSLQSLLYWLHRMVDLNLLPPFGFVG